MSETYIESLQEAIRQTHGCASHHVETVSVCEIFKGEAVWDGAVEVFDLDVHLQAQQCYAWGFQDEAGKWQYVAVLRVGPIDTPQRAVQAYAVSLRRGETKS